MTKQEIINQLYETSEHWMQEAELCDKLKGKEIFQNTPEYLEGRKDVWKIAAQYLRNLTVEFEEDM